MKKIILLLLIILGVKMNAQQVVIFDKNEVCFPDKGNAGYTPTDNSKIDFLDRFKKDNNMTAPFDSDASLNNPPLEWGKRVHDFKLGRIAYHTSFKEGFVCELWLNSLLPNHEYKLTINGRPDLAGNELLTEPVPGKPIEKYYDFLIVKTDSKGEYHSKLGVFLKQGNYHVRFYVKDADDSIIIMYHDYFKFTVE